MALQMLQDPRCAHPVRIFDGMKRSRWRNAPANTYSKAAVTAGIEA